MISQFERNCDLSWFAHDHSVENPAAFLTTSTHLLYLQAAKPHLFRLLELSHLFTMQHLKQARLPQTAKATSREPIIGVSDSSNEVDKPG